jgi:transcriptional regulator with XRE-family HTH domain
MARFGTFMEARGISAAQLAATARLDAKTVKALVAGYYAPSPVERQRLAGALGLDADEIDLSHVVTVEHLRGNGPQAGRPT